MDANNEMNLDKDFKAALKLQLGSELEIPLK